MTLGEKEQAFIEALSVSFGGLSFVDLNSLLHARVHLLYVYTVVVSHRLTFYPPTLFTYTTGLLQRRQTCNVRH